MIKHQVLLPVCKDALGFSWDSTINWLIAWFPNLRSSNVMSGYPKSVRRFTKTEKTVTPKGLKSGWQKGR